MILSLRFLMLLTLTPMAVAQACTITMGYRTTDRLPYIAEAPDNAGLYLDLYTEASRRIGCKLEVIRQPKKRILSSIQTGKVDFYPGLIPSPERGNDYYYAPNGLPSQQVALTRSGLPLMNSLEMMRGKDLLVSMGGVQKQAIEQGLNVRTPPELDIEKAFQFIETGRGDVYIDELSSLTFYLKNYPNKDKLMIHPNCCGGAKHFTMGISPASKNASYIPNPKFDPKRAINEENAPITLVPSSTLGRFSQTVLQLGQEGFTAKLYKKYYGIDMPELPDRK